MKRWNGWGDSFVDYPVPPGALEFLRQVLGEGKHVPDAELEGVLSSIAPSRLPDHPLIDKDASVRLLHARGQSLPDWVALRSGRIGACPDAVAYPASDTDVRALLVLAHETGASLIPYGGGTSVVGHINSLAGERPVLTVDMSRFASLHSLDETSRMVTVGAGLHGPALEALLAPLGLTLGHFPQSWEYSTVGGWIATRSSGQQSLYYGRIEELLAGGHVETPIGPLELLPVPASAAGPDLRQLLLGSEGHLGVITRAVLRVRAQPSCELFLGAFFPDWGTGVDAVRSIVQSGFSGSMLRRSDSLETETTLRLAGKPWLHRLATVGLSRLGFPEPALLIYGLTGEPETVNLARFQSDEIIREYGGIPVPFFVGRTWRKSRFHTPYLRNTLWDLGYAVDTLETAVPWSAVKTTAELVKAALQTNLLPRGERVLVFSHLSHVYRDGASIYVTCIFRHSMDPDETLSRWQSLKRAASLVLVGSGATISHQHGVGIDHAPYLAAEKGAVGLSALRAAFKSLDPERLMNPGKLLESTD